MFNLVVKIVNNVTWEFSEYAAVLKQQLIQTLTLQPSKY